MASSASVDKDISEQADVKSTKPAQAQGQAQEQEPEPEEVEDSNRDGISAKIEHEQPLSELLAGALIQEDQDLIEGIYANLRKLPAEDRLRTQFIILYSGMSIG